MIGVSQLHVHPVKSLRGLQLSHALATPSGLAYDRAFMVTEPDGTFITARQFPEMVLFTPALLPDGLFITAPNGEQALVRYADFITTPQPTEVWGTHFTARIAPEKINQWLGGYFKRPVQLRWVGDAPSRRVKRFPEIPLGFADGYPYLLVNESSFQALRQRCNAGIQLIQFRPNIVVTGADAFAEDSWQTLRIGAVTFDMVKPCSRCVLTTVSTERGRKHPSGEPLATLQSFRTADNGDVDFGQNMIARQSGIIRVGDRVEILATKPPRLYGAGTPTATLEAPKQTAQGISLHYQGKTLPGNNQQILLEQLEQHGVRVPYSCRAGVCGCCKMTLVSGEVSPLKQGAVREDNTILACCCVPQGDIVLA